MIQTLNLAPKIEALAFKSLKKQDLILKSRASGRLWRLSNIDDYHLSKSKTLYGEDIGSIYGHRFLFSSARNAIFEDIRIEHSIFEASSVKLANYTNTTFKSCIFRSCFFDSIDFSQANFDHSTFDSCTFVNCKFQGAKLNFVNFKETYFLKSQMTSCDFNRSNFNYVQFEKCKLDNASFEYAELAPSVLFMLSHLNDANFKNARIQASNFFVCEMKKSDFSRVYLKDTGFFACDLRFARFIDLVMDVEIAPDSDMKTWRIAPPIAVDLEQTYFIFSPFNDLYNLAKTGKLFETDNIKFHNDELWEITPKPNRTQYMNRFLSCDLSSASFYGVGDLLRKVIFRYCSILSMTISDTEMYRSCLHKIKMLEHLDMAFEVTMLEPEGIPLCATTEFILDFPQLLQRANLQSVYLKLVDFSNLNLEYIDCSNATLERVNFNDCEIKSSNFVNSSLKGCTFKNTEVSDTNMQATDFEFSEFENSKFSNVDLEGATFLYYVGLNTVEFSNVEMTQKDVESHFLNRLLTRNQMQNITLKDLGGGTNALAYISSGRKA